MDFFSEVKESIPDPNFVPDPELEPWDGHSVMDLEEFVEHCKMSLFVNYDGYGFYSNSKETYENSNDLIVHPSDICEGKIKTEYKYVHWFNR